MAAFLELLGTSSAEKSSLANTSKKYNIPASRLKYYDSQNIIPVGEDLEKLRSQGVSERSIRLALGKLSSDMLQELKSTGRFDLCDKQPKTKIGENPRNTFKTDLGEAKQMDCLELLYSTQSDSIDMIFADPPFNLNKLYPSQVDDSLSEIQYVEWCKKWLYECCRVLKHGGSIFIWNLPKWNNLLSSFISEHLTFRHNISVDIKYSLPIQGRLYPSNYSLLYFVKGPKPNAFNPDRLPMPICPHCFGDLRDYGGYKSKMNPEGINISDVWTDISPVRHRKYKKRQGSNELPIKLMDRVIQLGSNEGDLILDPFGGSGTTFVVSELKNRRWVGSEIGPLDHIVERFNNISDDKDYLEKIRSSLNQLFTDESKFQRSRRNLWTVESLAKVDGESSNVLDLFSEKRS